MRTKTELDLSLCQAIIDRVQPTALHISDLCVKVADEYNLKKANSYKEITFSVIRSNIEKYHTLTSTVKPGKRGQRLKGAVLSPEHRAAMVAGRKNRTEKVFDREALLKELPNEEKLIDRVVGGSMKAAIIAMCKSCTNSTVQPLEYKKCHIVSCPLHGFLKRDKAR